MKIGLACMHGGHFVEITRVLDVFKEHDYFFVTSSVDSKNIIEEGPKTIQEGDDILMCKPNEKCRTTKLRGRGW